MKIPRNVILGSLVVTALQLAQTGCVGPGGGGVEYGGGPWIDNETVVTGGGRGWFGGGDRGGGGYVHPSAGDRGGAKASPARSGGGDSHPSGGGESHAGGGDDHRK
jgi:CspA family cold shock protein